MLMACCGGPSSARPPARLPAPGVQTWTIPAPSCSAPAGLASTARGKPCSTMSSAIMTRPRCRSTALSMYRIHRERKRAECTIRASGAGSGSGAWFNGCFAIEHKGGHSPLSVDVTRFLDGLQLEIVVQAEEDPHDTHKVRAKMDWELDPHSIWYPRTSGIWRTVWMEKVARCHVRQLRWTADVAAWRRGRSVWRPRWRTRLPAPACSSRAVPSAPS